jgi:polyhydroxyalkanoate synthase subunit PhaC
VVGDETLDLGEVKIPIYELATREDHIAPPNSVFIGAKAFGGPVRYVLSGSGHIAGVVNPPARKKYQYWLGGSVEGSYEDWLEAATEHPGSWWPDWLTWLRKQAPEEVPAEKRKPGGRRKTLGDAPGSYVLVKS